MAPTEWSESARSKASASSWQRARFSALRFSGRFSVIRRTRASCITSINFNLHAENSRAVGLALGIDSQRHGPATAERFVQQQIDGAQIGKFEALDLAFDEIAEELFDSFGRHFAEDYRIMLRLESDDADVRGVPFIARTSMSDGSQ